ncbi:hypothetical protein KDW07_07925 [Burkholderia dolosa]|uniref:acetyl-CoA carboxylase biotin carboxyl carrier protein n=1 Tax=Burkholderia dolosa TaxID=152500 RepID=UPI001B950109|nr:hypothetical protein [Burkholderia dolosa]MBR8457088.1 hypothetical protein [Burkholderia dolosa]MDN7419413.1 hypothetical protein [Burkholderia dolosa]
MTPHDIEALAGVLHTHGVSACEVHDDKQGVSVKLRLLVGSSGTRERSSASAPANAEAPVTATKPPHVLRSPGMGRFAARHPLQENPAVTPGQRVESGQTVGYLLVGSMIDEITAPQVAILGRQLIEDGGLVGYGDAVFELS